MPDKLGDMSFSTSTMFASLCLAPIALIGCGQAVDSRIDDTHATGRDAGDMEPVRDATADGSQSSDTGIPICDIAVEENPAGGFNVIWSSMDALTSELSDGSSVVSTDLSGTLGVDPATPTRYSLSSSNESGTCSDDIVVMPASCTVIGGMATVPNCMISIAENPQGGFDLTWMATGEFGNMVQVTDQAGTLLSTDQCGVLNVASSPNLFTLSTDSDFCGGAVQVVRNERDI